MFVILPIRRWTTTESDISMRDLKKMSSRFRRPLSVLLMAKAPATTVPMYRRSGDPAAGARPPRAVLEVIRKARYVQGNAAVLLNAMNRTAEPSVRRATLGQSPESAASESAAALEIEPPRRTGQGADRDKKRYSMIREKIESQNVFAMQERIPEDGIAGFALADTKPAIILVNWRDSARRRIFTILHEYAHVLLNDDSVCPASGAAAINGGGTHDIELWCDRFASAVLMPAERFRDTLMNAHENAGGDPIRTVTDLSNIFCVSGMAAAARAVCVLDDAGLRARYSHCCGALSREPEMKTDKRGENKAVYAGCMGQAAMCIARKGRRYAHLVATASESGSIATSTALDYLEIKLKNFEDLKMRCVGR